MVCYPKFIVCVCLWVGWGSGIVYRELSYLILMIMLLDSQYYYQPHFGDKKI